MTATSREMMVGSDRVPAATPPLSALLEAAEQAGVLLRSIANTRRLLILCVLVEGERSVGELEAIIGLSQPTMSQQLARLREDGLVATRRQGKLIYYSLCSAEAREVIALLHRLYCPQGVEQLARATPRDHA